MTSSSSSKALEFHDGFAALVTWHLAGVGRKQRCDIEAPSCSPAVTHEPFLPQTAPGDAGDGRVRPHSAPRIGAAHVNLALWRTDGAPDWQAQGTAYTRCRPLTLDEESAMTAPCFRIAAKMEFIRKSRGAQHPRGGDLLSSSTHQAEMDVVMEVSPRSTTAGLGVSCRTAKLHAARARPQCAPTPCCCRWDLDGKPGSS